MASLALASVDNNRRFQGPPTFGDARVSTWTTPRRRDQIHVPAALIAAAGVARLTVAADEVVFDIPTLLDATLQLCEPVGNA